MSHFRPLHDRILVQRVNEDEYRGPIIIPDAFKSKVSEGIVKAVGAGKVTSEGVVLKSELAVGERVLFGKFPGTEIAIAGVPYVVLREDEILAVYQG